MKSPVRPELTTASVVRRQATPAAVDNSASLQTRPLHLSIGVNLFKSTEPLLDRNSMDNADNSNQLNLFNF